MEATEARRGYARVAAWDEGNLIQAMAREIEKQRASSCRGRACTVAICQSTSSLRVACALWNALVLCFAVHQG